MYIYSITLQLFQNIFNTIRGDILDIISAELPSHPDSLSILISEEGNGIDLTKFKLEELVDIFKV